MIEWTADLRLVSLTSRTAWLLVEEHHFELSKSISMMKFESLIGSSTLLPSRVFPKRQVREWHREVKAQPEPCC